MKTKKGILSIIYVLLILFLTTANTHVYAKTKTSFTEEEQKLIQAYPNLEKSLSKYPKRKLVKTTNKYYKVVTKEAKNTAFKSLNNISSDKDTQLDYIEVTEEEFKNAKLLNSIEPLNNTIFSLYNKQIGNGDATSSDWRGNWLHLTLQVYSTNSKYKFKCYSFFEWLRKPSFTLTDVQAITCTSQMIVSKNPEASAYYYYDIVSKNGNTVYSTATNKCNFTLREHGVISYVDLIGSSEIVQTSWHRGLMEVNIEFAQKISSEQGGRIFAKYAHKEGMASIGIDSSGNLSISPAIVVDEADSPSVYVTAK